MVNASPQIQIAPLKKHKIFLPVVTLVKAERRIAVAAMTKKKTSEERAKTTGNTGSTIKPVTPSPKQMTMMSAGEELGSFTDSSFEQSLKLISEQPIGGAVNDPTAFVAAKRSNKVKVKSLISLFTKGKSAMIAVDDTPTRTTGSKCAATCIVSAEKQSGRNDAYTPTPETDFSFEHALDTIINVSDDILNLSVEDACIDLVPIAKASMSLTPPFKEETPSSDSFSTARSKIGDALEHYDVVKNQEPVDEDYSSLIRDIERAPTATATTDDSPVCQLDFSSEAEGLGLEDVVKRKVVIQDDLNTVRYFCRSKEERAFVGRVPMSKPKRRNYSAPLPDSPVRKSCYEEDDIVGAMADLMSEHLRGVEEGGTKLRDEVIVHTDEFIKWAKDENFVEKLEETSSQLKTSLNEKVTEASTTFKEACIALQNSIYTTDPTEPATDEFGNPVVTSPRSFSQTFEESTSKLKATIEESSNSIFQSMSGETILCVSRRTAEEAKGVEVSDIPEYTYGSPVVKGQDELEPPLHEEMVERAFSETLHFATTNSSPSKIQDFGISMIPLDTNIFHKEAADISTDSHPYIWSRTEDYAESAISEGGMSTEILLRTNGKLVLAEEGSDLLRCQSMKPEKVGLSRKRNVVNGARRWNMKQQTPTEGDTETKTSVFLELEEAQDDILQPSLLDISPPSSKDPVTPTTNDIRSFYPSDEKRRFRKAVESSPSSDKTETFRKAAEFFKRMDIAKTRSPVSAVDL